MSAVVTIRPATEGLGAGPLVNSSLSEEVCEDATFPDQDSRGVASDVAAGVTGRRGGNYIACNRNNCISNAFSLLGRLESKQ